MGEDSAILSARIRRFLSKPAKEKLNSVRFRLMRLLPKWSATIKLPFGATWVLEKSALDAQLRSGTFEARETRFMEIFLQPGMTVLDIGAHHGYYTLLASIMVETKGSVVAFEPSRREGLRLKRHIRMNGCTNVVIEQAALGAAAGEADLYLVDGPEDYCNSLRPPAVSAQTCKVRVRVQTLDQFLARHRIGDIDFIKLDVEGAELDVLRGASGLLSQSWRPVFMIEVYDIRTQPWGYNAREIVQFIAERGYTWFRLEESGKPLPADLASPSFDANLVAVPIERMPSFGESVIPRF
jgi:FkbM family methyltransferase